MIKNKYNKSIIFILQLVLTSNASYSSAQTSGIFTKENYSIPLSIEPDIGYNHLLSDYIFQSILNNPIDLKKDSLDNLFIRPSFKFIATELLNNSILTEIDVTQGRDYFTDYRFNYLLNCNNTEVLHSIADTLMSCNSINGLIGIWNKCNIKELTNYCQFLHNNVRNKNLYNLLCLITILHNNQGNINEYEYLKTQLLKIDTNEALISDYIEYLDSAQTVSYYDFLCFFDWF